MKYFNCFVDLDHTFIQSVNHTEGQPSQLVYNNNGKAIVITEKQLQVWNGLKQVANVIPVTARSLERTLLCQDTLGFDSYLVTDHGSFIYTPDDQLLVHYVQSVIYPLVIPLQQSLRMVEKYLSLAEMNLGRSFGLRFNTVRHGRHSLLIEGTTESLRATEILIHNLYLTMDTFGLKVNSNGRSFSVTCVEESYKGLAVKYLQDTFPEEFSKPSIGFGDSRTDMPFLMQCDFASIPIDVSTQLTLN